MCGLKYVAFGMGSGRDKGNKYGIKDVSGDVLFAGI